MRRRAFQPRYIIQFIIFVAFVAVVSLIFTTNNQDYAALSYPPFPEDEYKDLSDARKHCKFSEENAEHIESIGAGVAYVESRFRKDNNIVSSAGAVGRMQLLRPTLAGMGVKYQIPGINASTANDVRISYFGGMCYLHYLMETIAGDGASTENWNDEQKRKAVYIAYNAGPARGKSYLAGNYNGPLSSLGYAEKVERAARVYRLDIARLRQQEVLAPTETLSNQLRNLVWSFLLEVNN